VGIGIGACWHICVEGFWGYGCVEGFWGVFWRYWWGLLRSGRTFVHCGVVWISVWTLIGVMVEDPPWQLSTRQGFQGIVYRV